jgi:iron complex outermembrane receptor protein
MNRKRTKSPLRRGRQVPILPLLTTATLLAPLAAHAQQSAPEERGGLQEVTVTAQKRDESIQDVALSITALTAEDLEKTGAAGFRDWADYVPGVRIYQGTTANRRAGPTAVMRGVSQSGAGQLNEVSSQATTSYTVGNVPVFSGDPGMFDLDRIEVLRGPQGTLFGVASMGGTIRFIPKLARTDEAEFEVGAGFGNIYEGSNTYEASFMGNVPIVQDVFAVRLAANYRENEGYIDYFQVPLNITRGADISVTPGAFDPRVAQQDVNNSSSTGARLSAVFTPNDVFKATLFTMWQQSDQATKQIIDINDQRGGYNVSRYSLEPQEDEFTVTSLELSYDVGVGHFEYVGGYVTNKLFEQLDVTGFEQQLLNGMVPVLDFDGPGGLPADGYPAPTIFPFGTETRIVTNELRFQGEEKPFFGGMTVDYVIGAFHMTEDRHGNWGIRTPTWNQDRGPNTAPINTAGGLMLGQRGGGDYESHSVFGDLVVNLTSKLSIGGGLRYSDSRRTNWSFSNGELYSGLATNGVTVGDNLNVGRPPGSPPIPIEQTSTTPRFTAQYSLSEDKLLFFTAAKGERLPSSSANPTFFDNPNINPVCRPLAEQLGVADDAINGTVTDTVWSYDLGIKSKWLDNRLLFNATVFMPIIAANVGAVDVQGFELETVFAPTEFITLNAAIGYTDAEVAETVVGVRDSLGEQLEKGDELENVAPWTAAVGAEFRFGLPVLGDTYQGFARADWRYTAERANAIGDRDAVKASPLWSQFVAAPYTLTDLRVGVNADSWTTSFYIANVFNEQAVYESYGGGWFPNARFTAISQPRTIGVTMKKTF